MSKKRKTETQLVAELRAVTGKRGSLKETAERLEVTIAYLHDVINGRRNLTDRIAVKLGYRRVVEFERVA